MAVARRRACARRSLAARLAFGQSFRTMLQRRGQKNGLDRASPPLAWVSTAAGRKSLGTGGWGGPSRCRDSRSHRSAGT